jgi:hypothetical protein
MSIVAASEELSAYEIERMANIKRNAAVLDSLGLVGGLVPHAKVPRRAPKPKSTTFIPPERRSARNQGVKAPGFYVEHELSRGGIRVGGDSRALEKEREEDKERVAEAKKASDPLARFAHDVFPEEEDHLLEGEKYAFRALRDARRATAKELQMEGYKIAHNRSLCEMVRRLPESAAELSECWGFGGSGKRVKDFGELFLGVLAPRVKKLRSVHYAARQAWDVRKAGEKEEDEKEEAGESSGASVLENMPQSKDDLLEAEASAYETLIAATHARAEAIGEQYVWNIALSRSLCEMVRRCPTNMEALRGCWGFGGAGLKAQKHGAFLLAALKPCIPSIEAAHAALRAEAVRTDGGDVARRSESGSIEHAGEAEAKGEASLESGEASPQIGISARQAEERSVGRTGRKRKATGKATDVEAAPRRRTRLSSASGQ